MTEVSERPLTPEEHTLDLLYKNTKACRNEALKKTGIDLLVGVGAPVLSYVGAYLIGHLGTPTSSIEALGAITSLCVGFGAGIAGFVRSPIDLVRALHHDYNLEPFAKALNEATQTADAELQPRTRATRQFPNRPQ